MIDKKIIISLFIVGIHLTGTSAIAAGPCCAKCGNHENVQCVCRPVYTTKYIEITCWDSACENVCLPSRSRNIEDCSAYRAILDFFTPTGRYATDVDKTPKFRTCNKLVRKTYLQPVPAVVWVEEYRCQDCLPANTESGAAQDPNASARRINDSDSRRSGKGSSWIIGEDDFSRF
jgi:hypothetical protein